MLSALGGVTVTAIIALAATDREPTEIKRLAYAYLAVWSGYNAIPYTVDHLGGFLA